MISGEWRVTEIGIKKYSTKEAWLDTSVAFNKFSGILLPVGT